jgi:hypothetical protein
MIVPILSAKRRQLAPLFQPYRCQRVFIEGAMDGCFGSAWAENADSPQAALLYHGLVYWGGDPSCPTAEKLVRMVLTFLSRDYCGPKAWLC